MNNVTEFGSRGLEGRKAEAEGEGEREGEGYFSIIQNINNRYSLNSININNNFNTHNIIEENVNFMQPQQQLITGVDISDTSTLSTRQCREEALMTTVEENGNERKNKNEEEVVDSFMEESLAEILVGNHFEVMKQFSKKFDVLSQEKDSEKIETNSRINSANLSLNLSSSTSSLSSFNNNNSCLPTTTTNLSHALFHTGKIARGKGLKDYSKFIKLISEDSEEAEEFAIPCKNRNTMNDSSHKIINDVYISKNDVYDKNVHSNKILSHNNYYYLQRDSSLRQLPNISIKSSISNNKFAYDEIELENKQKNNSGNASIVDFYSSNKNSKKCLSNATTGTEREVQVEGEIQGVEWEEDVSYSFGKNIAISSSSSSGSVSTVIESVISFPLNNDDEVQHRCNNANHNIGEIMVSFPHPPPPPFASSCSFISSTSPVAVAYRQNNTIKALNQNPVNINSCNQNVSFDYNQTALSSSPPPPCSSSSSSLPFNSSSSRKFCLTDSASQHLPSQNTSSNGCLHNSFKKKTLSPRSNTFNTLLRDMHSENDNINSNNMISNSVNCCSGAAATSNCNGSNLASRNSSGGNGSNNISELRRVRFSGENIFSYYGRGNALSPGVNSGVSYLPSCGDNSLCYSLSMTTLEATASAPTHSGTTDDIYSRWEVAPLPDGCSYEASWSQAMLQSLPPGFNRSNNQSINSPPVQQGGGCSTVSTLGGFCTPQNIQNGGGAFVLPRQFNFTQRSPSACSARNFHQASSSPSECRSSTNNAALSYLRYHNRCAPVTPHRHFKKHATGSGMRASGCRTTTNLCYRNNNDDSNSNELSVAVAAMAAAVAQINLEYKNTKKNSNNSLTNNSLCTSYNNINASNRVVVLNGENGNKVYNNGGKNRRNLSENGIVLITDAVLQEIHHQRHAVNNNYNQNSSNVATLTRNLFTTGQNSNRYKSKSKIDKEKQNFKEGRGEVVVIAENNSSASSLKQSDSSAERKDAIVNYPVVKASPEGEIIVNNVGGVEEERGREEGEVPAAITHNNNYQSSSISAVGALSKTFLPILKRNGGWSRHLRNGTAASPASATHSKSRTPLGSWTTTNLISRLSRYNNSFSSSSSSSASSTNNNTTETSITPSSANSTFGNIARALRHSSSKQLRQQQNSSSGCNSFSTTNNKVPQDLSVCTPTEIGSKAHECLQAASHKICNDVGSLSCLDTRESLDLYCMLRKNLKEARGGKDTSISYLTDGNDALPVGCSADRHLLNHAAVIGGNGGVTPGSRIADNANLALSQKILNSNRIENNNDDSPSPSASCRSSCWGNRKYRKANRSVQFSPDSSTSGPLGTQPNSSPSVLKRTCSRTYTSAQTQALTPTGGVVFGDVASHENFCASSALPLSSSSSSTFSYKNTSRPSLNLEITRKERRCFTAAAAAFFPNSYPVRSGGTAGGGTAAETVNNSNNGISATVTKRHPNVSSSPPSPSSTLPLSLSCQQNENLLIAAQNSTRNSSTNLLYDLEFGGLRVKLYKKLSAKCHCQFDVWEAEVVQIMHCLASAYKNEDKSIINEDKENVSSNVVHEKSNLQNGTIGGEIGASEKNVFPNSSSPIVPPEDLGQMHLEKVGVGIRFALKLLEVNVCEPAKLKYKTHSITAEGRQLKNLYEQMHQTYTESGAIKNGNSDGERNNNTNTTACTASLKCVSNLMPIPKYFWTASGSRKLDSTKVLGVAMELIQGRSLTQILQQLRCPTKQSAALLAIEIALKIVESQQVLVGGLLQPLINWDTKPGNILLELIRSTSGRLHCRRAVIIDLGDALPGPEYWFPTRHRPGETPGYIICTKGYCSPECAVLVFMLASSSRCGGFRKVWYGENAQVERLQEARKQRLPNRWRQWVKEGFLRRTYVGGNQATPQSSPASSTVSTGISLSFQSSSSFTVNNTTTTNTSGTAPHISTCGGGGVNNANAMYNSPPHNQSVEDACNSMSMINNNSITGAGGGGSCSGNGGSLANCFGVNATQQNTTHQFDHLHNDGGVTVLNSHTSTNINNSSKNHANSRGSSASRAVASSVSTGEGAGGIGGVVGDNHHESAINSNVNNNVTMMNNNITANNSRNLNTTNLIKAQQQQQYMRTDRGCWEVNFTEKSVVFSTGLVLAQIFGGPNLLQVVEKDEVRALDLLCEWGFCDTVNFYSGRQNLGPRNLLPSTGVFAEEPWRSKILVLLEGCLAFVPSKRWSFTEVQTYLIKLYEEYVTSYNVSKRSGIVNAIQQATNFRVKRN